MVANNANRPEVVTAPAGVSPEPLRRAAVPLASAKRLDDTNERLQEAKGVLQQTMQRMLSERPDLVQRLVSARMPKEIRPEAAGPEEVQERTQAMLLPETQQALQQMLPQLIGENLRNTLNSAVNGSNEKGQ